MKQLILNIEKTKIRLDLVSGRKNLDSLEWKENNNLSRTLLRKIDEILKKNKIRLDPAGNLSRKSLHKTSHSANISNGVDKISGYKIMSDVPKNWTSVRIAEITLKSLMIAGLAR